MALFTERSHGLLVLSHRSLSVVWLAVEEEQEPSDVTEGEDPSEIHRCRNMSILPAMPLLPLLPLLDV